MTIPFIEEYAITVITVLLVVFAGVFLILFLYTTLHRYILSRRIQRDIRTEEKLQPLIYAYLDDQIDESDFSAHIHKQNDLMVAHYNINIMIDNLSGEERKRLQRLLEIPKFKKYFLKKLRSRRPMHIAQACMYFSQKSGIDPKSIRRLSGLQQHAYKVIAYASTLALINSNNRNVRDQALLRFLYRKQNASMAVHDIIFKYYEKRSDHVEATEKLVFYVMDNNIPDRTKAAVVAMFPGLGFYEYSSDLHNLLLRVIPNDQTGILTSTLIRVLHELSGEEVLLELENHQLWKSPFTNVRLQATQVFADQDDPRLKDILLQLAHDPDLEVRIIAQQALLKMDQADLPDREFSTNILPEWEEMKRSGGEYVYSF